MGPIVFPAERTNLEQGGTTWAVVLAGAADSDAPTIQDEVGTYTVLLG